ncbi:MAG: helix-turn-helix transcriptional regulator [Acidobacteriales bacterium]|nr:helix-turn-helix transcriptional regulator [Terriglobales bacterium]
MKTAEKIRYLREVEGQLRGLGRALTQQEVVDGIGKQSGANISQSYLSQIESGARPHLTNPTRMALARFYRVHPGYLVDDPEGYHAELQSELREQEQSLDVWLFQGAEIFAKRDAELSDVLIEIARQDDSRQCLLLLAELLKTPDMVPRLREALCSQEDWSAEEGREK